MVLIKWCVYVKYWYVLLKYFNSKIVSRIFLCFFDFVGVKVDGGNRSFVIRLNYGC